ncbi:MAG TPA: 4Fe-4S cluster-binding domain-containing protein [Anaerolineae bacterium]|nr:4Fe-4S cluster-binding domain-containing protein [Anaerolineae bacterium]
MEPYKPAYLRLLESSELKRRAMQAKEMLACCMVCAWNCEVDRTARELGQCRTGALARVSNFMPHHGEEKPLSGWLGSGTIFFAGCNMHCQYCQNSDISQSDGGIEVNDEELAAMMMALQKQGCHNINFVSPSHVVPQILGALVIAARADLHLPLVYNTGGYDALPTLKLLDGIIDIYMPDMKYADEKVARKYSKIPNYPAVNQAAVREMHRQVGDLQINGQGIALRGLLVRHLLLPNGLAGTTEIMEFLANKISKYTYVNIMDQYHPEYHAQDYAELSRCITSKEYNSAVQTSLDAGLHRFDKPISPLL